MRTLVEYWALGFDWRAQERWLNGFDNNRVQLEGVRIHFVHQRARTGHGIPLILSHGWPSNFVELLPLLPLLTDPAGHGIDGPAFDVVVPSLPGYGLSERLFDVRHWTRMERGGHFAPAEEPMLVARDICAFFAGL